MLLKNVTKEVVEIRYDGVSHVIPPEKSIDIEIMHPGADVQLQTNLAEQFENGTGGKLARIATPGGIPSGQEPGAKKDESAAPGRRKRKPRG